MNSPLHAGARVLCALMTVVPAACASVTEPELPIPDLGACRFSEVLEIERIGGQSLRPGVVGTADGWIVYQAELGASSVRIGAISRTGEPSVVSSELPGPVQNMGRIAGSDAFYVGGTGNGARFDFTVDPDGRLSELSSFRGSGEFGDYLVVSGDSALDLSGARISYGVSSSQLGSPDSNRAIVLETVGNETFYAPDSHDLFWFGIGPDAAFVYGLANNRITQWVSQSGRLQMEGEVEIERDEVLISSGQVTSSGAYAAQASNGTWFHFNGAHLRRVPAPREHRLFDESQGVTWSVNQAADHIDLSVASLSGQQVATQELEVPSPFRDNTIVGFRLLSAHEAVFYGSHGDSIIYTALTCESVE